MSELDSTTCVVDDDHDDEPFGTTPLPTSLPIRGSDGGVGGGSGTGNGIGVGTSSSSSAVVVVPVSITLDMDPILSGPPSSTVAQQPHTQQIAVYEATPNEACINGSLLDVNQHFVVYAVKNGLIRVLHRHSAMRALLRGHAGQVITDIRFFLDGDVLGTVGSTGGGGGNDGTLPMSTLIVWRVFEQSPEIMSEKLLEISSHPGLSGTAPDLTMSRLLWHPFNPNQFWMVHSTRTSSSSSSLLEVATLVETTRIQTRVHPADGENHALCLWHSPYCVMDGALQLIERPGSHNGGAGGNLTDLAWSGRDTRHVLTVHDNGSIILWDLKQKTAVGGGGYGSVDSDGEDGLNDDVTVPKRLFVVHEDGVPHSRCCFLPHDDSVRQDEALRAAGGDGTTAPLTTCFATAAHQNTVVTLWSAFTSGNQPPTKLQEVNLVPHPTRGTVTTPTSFVMDVCFGPAPPNAAPPSCFLLFGSRQEGRLLALHVRSVWSQEPMQHQHQQDVVLKPKDRALCVGVDYVVPFTLKHPIYSWSVVCSPTQDIAEEEIQERAGLIFDMKAFAYQSKLVQCLTLTSYMCLPPEHGYKSGSSNSSTIVRVEQLKGKYVNTDVATNIRSTTTTPLGLGGGSSTPSPLDADYGEDYDIDDEFDNADGDDDGDDDDDVDDAAAVAGRPVLTAATVLPLPATGTGNPFANWLGAIATNSSLGGPFPNGNASGMPLPPPPPPPVPPSTPATGLEGIPMPPPPGLAPPATVSGPNGPPSFLSPMDLFQPPPAGNEPSTVKQDTIQANGKDKKKKGRQNSPKRSKSPKGGNKKQNNNDNNNNKMPFPDGKVAILRRDGVAPAHASAAVPPPIPNDPSVLSDPAILAAAGIPVMDHFAVTPAPPPPQLPTTVVSTIDPDVLREQVAQAVEQALASVVVPTVNKAIKESFVSLARPLQLSMDTLRKQGVTVDSNDLQKALNVETPLKAAMAETMRNSLVPALESITAQILNQVQTSMPPPPPDQSKALDLLVQQVAGMSTKMDALTKEVQVLRTAVANQAAAAAAAAASSHGSAQTNPPSAPQAPAPTQQPAMLKLEQTRNEITHLLSVEQYEAAFTKAVSASTADMAVFACARADLSKVLGGSAPTLSQPILLCLMQQLGAALPGTTSPDHLSLELSWLQEIALTLNPSEPSIQRHVPTVLQQLVGSINGKMSAEGNGQIRRKLQMLLQVLRGMQLG